MKKIVFLFFCIACVSSCVQQMEEPESAKISGMWAVVDENDMTTQYMTFQHGYFQIYQSDRACYVADKSIYSVDEATFTQKSRNKYSLIDGVLHSAKNSVELILEDEIMSFGGRKCLPINDFNSSYYSEIVFSETNKTSLLYSDREIEWDYNIENPVEGFSLTVKEAPEWCGGVRGVTVEGGKIRFAVQSTTESLSGKFVLSYLSAADVEVEVEQSAAQIILDKTSATFSYSAATGEFAYTIPNKQEGYELEVKTDAGWIKDIKNQGDKITYSVLENNSGAERTGKIELTYAGVIAEYTVTQAYSASSVNLTPSSATHNYAGGTFSFKYIVENPREGQEVRVSSEASWITEVKDVDGLVSYTVSENNSGDKRMANITLTYDGQNVKFEVTQTYSSSLIVLTPSSATHNYAGGTFSFKYKVENPREGQKVSVSTSDSWITGLKDSNGTVSYTITENNSDSSRSGKITVIYAGVCAEFTVVQNSVLVNLAQNGAANCYVISEAGTYYFPLTKGNSDSSVGSVRSVEVLWESFGTSITPSVGDLVKSVTIVNDNLVFDTAENFREGNAVVAVKDADDNILWSWHIWLTDQPAGQVYYNDAGTMMDRNLGATSATPGDAGALGLLYQWGRKDPFLGSSSISESTRAKSTITWPSSVSSDSSKGTIAYATSHPTTFIRQNYLDDWYYTEHTDNTRWATSSSDKSIYDPCPPGWRVPDGGDNGIWSKALGLSSDSSGTFDSTNKGMDFSGVFGPATTIWYPASGGIGDDNNYLDDVGRNCYYWSALSMFSLFNSGGFDPNCRLRECACGRPVRCSRE